MQHDALRMEMLVRQSRWEDVLRIARTIPTEKHTIGTGHDMNRALAELGIMGDEMFAYPAALDGLTLGLEVGTQASEVAKHMRMQLYFQITDLPMRMGVLNDAEHDHHEALEVFGPHGCTLKRLALINLAKGQIAAARKFLNVASRDLVYGRWARETLAAIDRDPGLSGIPEVAQMRQVMLPQDVEYLGFSLEQRCKALLEVNPRNRMALEYLMALYLLSRRLDDLAANIYRANALGLGRLPRHWAEGLAVYCGTDDARLRQYGSRIDTDTMRRYVDFGETLRGFEQAGDIQGARVETAREHGNSYFYFHAFGRSGEGPQ